jgi:hypothetical protein
MIEEIKWEGKCFAIIVSNDFDKEGITFFTPNEFSQQMAFMKHPKNKNIEPHFHNSVSREVHFTNEVLFIKKGKLRVDFYASPTKYLESRILNQGDFILLSEGGHGFSVLEDLEMIEIKQGPYVGNLDKTRFKPINIDNIKIK